jgi:hypothetical protein
LELKREKRLAKLKLKGVELKVRKCSRFIT